MRRLGIIIPVTVALLGTGMVATAIIGPSRLVSIVQSKVAPSSDNKSHASQPKSSPLGRAELAPDQKDTLRLPADVVQTLGITTGAVKAPDRSRHLVLSGSLALDTNRLAHVHTRFPGEVVDLGTVAEKSSGTNGGSAIKRPLRFGDAVEKGQLLAVLWSSDLGEKKSEYIDVLSRLHMEKETLARQETLFKDEATPERNLREARRAVESSQIAVARSERTLRSWRLSDQEIAAIRTEAQAMHARDARLDPDREKSWARVELRAPLSGIILEINLAVGDIVATDTDLFKIADMSTLRVWSYVYEEDLPVLLSLPRPIRWTVHLKSDPQAAPIVGTADQIGNIIDPNQHTALVVGQVDNPEGRMRAGQFITTEIELPSDPDEVTIPISALVEDGQESIVFLQPDAGQPVYAMRRVTVARRAGNLAYLRDGRSPSSGRASTGERSGKDALRPGQKVVTSGAVELRAALSGLQDDATPGD
jgi:cobalt-zinc-cadmium efflux system membrane fusion protein